MLVMIIGLGHKKKVLVCPLVHLRLGGGRNTEIAALDVKRPDLHQVRLFLRAILALDSLHN